MFRKTQSVRAAGVISMTASLRYLFVSLLILLVLPVSWAQAAERPKVGLVLSGGGARGAAHIGVLRELERQRIPVDFIAGTSMGSIIGALYASGMNADEVEAAYRMIDWEHIFSDAPPREELSLRRKFDDATFQIDKQFGFEDGRLRLPSGFIRGQKLELLLQDLLLHVAYVEDFDRLPIPFRAVASDISSNEVVVLGSGNIAMAVRASMAVPGVFTAVEYDGRLLVDGGITNNTPVDVVRAMGADVVIAVDIGSPLLGRDQISSMFSVAAQLSNILVRRTTEQQLATLTATDILITPDLGDFSSADFVNAVQLIDKGEAATTVAAERLAGLATPNRVAQACENCTQPLPVIDFIRIDNDTAIADEFIRLQLRQAVGDPLDLDMLRDDIGRLYGLDIFDSVTYDIEQRDGQDGLSLTLRQKAWGPRYLQFGLSYSSNLGDSSNLALLAGYTITPLNSLNGEWRNILRLGEEPGLVSELHQPLGINSRYFGNLVASYLNQRYNLIDDGNNTIAEARVERVGLDLALGREFGSVSDLRLGYRGYTGDTEIKIGDPNLPAEDFTGGEAYILGRYDSLDNFFFPRSGWYGNLEWLTSRESLGADEDFDQVGADIFGAWTRGRHTLQLGGRYQTTYNGTAPIQNSFRLGGLFNLPGYNDNELSGQNVALLRSGYLHQSDWTLMSMPTNLGVTLQYGGVFEDTGDLDWQDLTLAGALYLGLDTFIGPIYVGYGAAEAGHQSVYVRIGGLL